MLGTQNFLFKRLKIKTYVNKIHVYEYILVISVRFSFNFFWKEYNSKNYPCFEECVQENYYVNFLGFVKSYFYIFNFKFSYCNISCEMEISWNCLNSFLSVWDRWWMYVMFNLLHHLYVKEWRKIQKWWKFVKTFTFCKFYQSISLRN